RAREAPPRARELPPPRRADEPPRLDREGGSPRGAPRVRRDARAGRARPLSPRPAPDADPRGGAREGGPLSRELRGLPPGQGAGGAPRADADADAGVGAEARGPLSGRATPSAA